jgi:NAD(P)H-hydrate epimerase
MLMLLSTMTTDNTSLPLYSAAQLRELDRRAIEEAGIPGYTLMTRAGEACWAVINQCWPGSHALTVFCGAGNNGGDGFVIARLALQANWQVQVYQLGDVARLPADARQARDALTDAGGLVSDYVEGATIDADIVVDALLGTGVDRPVEGLWRSAIETINASARPVLAVDIPSGLHSDTGAHAGVATVAARTVTFIGRKVGLYTGVAADHCGEIHFADLAVPGSVTARVAAAARLLLATPTGSWFAARKRVAHKGDFGHLLVIGGDHGMSGAVRLAGEAALRTGAGLVSVATRPQHAALIAAACPELMCHGIAQPRQLRPLLDTATVILIGPGLGRSGWARALLAAVLQTRQPRVMDADALNGLAGQPQPFTQQVLTPHPGEAARLLNQSTAAIQADRLKAARDIAQQYGGTSVVKGAGSVIQPNEGMPVVCAAGNPGMATAGSGDVLSGIIAALIAQGLGVDAAAVSGVCLHAQAGDLAARAGERGLIARDIIASLRTLMSAGDVDSRDT